MGSDDIVQYATWADDIRQERPDTALWHYVDIPGGRLVNEPLLTSETQFAQGSRCSFDLDRHEIDPC
jgi:hypothetical protein